MLMLIPVLPGPCDDPYTYPYERPVLPEGASWGHASGGTTPVSTSTPAVRC